MVTVGLSEDMTTPPTGPDIERWVTDAYHRLCERMVKMQGSIKNKVGLCN